MAGTGRFWMALAVFVVVAAYQPARASSQTPTKVLLIGDSICNGYYPVVQQLFDSQYTGQYTLSRGGGGQGTQVALTSIDALMATGPFDVIHFNWGLWDCRHVLNPDGSTSPDTSLGAVTITQYEANLRTLVGKMQATGARLIWANTTPVLWDQPGNGRTDPDVRAYNAVACGIMAEKGIQVDDLYGLVKPRLAELQSQAYSTDVHFTAQGYQVLGQGVAQAIVTVPEPASASLLLLGAVAGLLRRRTGQR